MSGQILGIFNGRDHLVHCEKGGQVCRVGAATVKTTLQVVIFSAERRSERIEWLKRLRLSCGRMIRLHAHPLPPSPVSKLPLLLSLPVCRLSSLLTGEGGGRSRIVRPQISLIFYKLERMNEDICTSTEKKTEEIDAQYQSK